MPGHDQNPPRCSVVIPTYNRPDALRTCLRALAAMDTPRDQFEVIVVDDGGASDLSAVGEPLRDRLDLTIVRQANAGPGAARNAGVAAAKFDAIAFTDDDCMPHRDWLAQLMRAHQCHPQALIGGACRNALPKNPFSTASQMILEVVDGHFNRDRERAVFFPSENMALSRQCFNEVGGFDGSFRWSEDRDLCDRWAARGWRLIVVPEAIVDHAHEMGIVGFWKQHFGYGRGAWRFHRAREHRGTGHLQVEGGFYFECFREPFRRYGFARGIELAALMGVWQVANTAGFAYESMLFDPPRSAAKAP